MINGHFIGTDKTKRYYRSWTLDRKTAGTVILVHGYAEHGDRYTELASKLNAAGFDVWAHDHYGHGNSDGKRADVPRFELFVDDTIEFINTMVQSGSLEKPLFLYGHSMGGAIALLTVIRNQSRFRGLILSGPIVRPGAQSGWFERTASHILRRIVPTLKFMPFEAGNICTDPDVVQNYIRDPLVYTDKMKIRMADSFLEAERLISDEALSSLTLPILLMHGGDDKSVLPVNSEIVYSLVQSPDKTRQVFDGMYHEIHNEPEKEKVFELVSSWLRKHV